MTDEEWEEALTENLVWRTQEFRPDYDDFGNWDAFKAAEAEFYRQVESGDAPWMQEMAAEAEIPVEELAELIGGKEGIERQFREYDSPLEAAQRIYKDSYIDGAYEARDGAYAPWGAWKEALVEAGFGDINELWDQYNAFPEGSNERRAFWHAYPELKAYMEFRDGYREEHPEAVWENVEAQVAATEAGFGPIDAVQFIPQILKVYKERGWTEEELEEELEGLTFPGFVAYREMRQREKGAAQRETPTAQGAVAPPAVGRPAFQQSLEDIRRGWVWNPYFQQYTPRFSQRAAYGGWGGRGGGGAYQRSPWWDWGPLQQRFTWRT